MSNRRPAIVGRRPLPPLQPPRIPVDLPLGGRRGSRLEGRGMSRPSLAATNDVRQQFNGPPPEFEAPDRRDERDRESPGTFPDSPGPESRLPQAGRAQPPAFGPRGPQQPPPTSAQVPSDGDDLTGASGQLPPFAAEDGLFEPEDVNPSGSRGPIVPVRPPGSPPLRFQGGEEAVPPPPSDPNDEAEGGGNAPTGEEDYQNEREQEPEGMDGQPQLMGRQTQGRRPQSAGRSPAGRPNGRERPEQSERRAEQPERTGERSSSRSQIPNSEAPAPFDPSRGQDGGDDEQPPEDPQEAEEPTDEGGGNAEGGRRAGGRERAGGERGDRPQERGRSGMAGAAPDDLRPILPVRPTNVQQRTGESWNISDAQAAGLINGEDLDGSQEGRCVTCGPRNQFETVDPKVAQRGRPTGAEEEDGRRRPLNPNGKGGKSYARPFASRVNLKPDPSTEPPAELFPSPAQLKFGDLPEFGRQAILRTCHTKLDCKVEPFGSLQKRNDVHRFEWEVQRRYAPYATERSIERRLDKIHMVKLLMLNAAGLADHVTPTNDGTIEQDVLLTDDQAEYLLHKLHVARRNKRAAIYMEQMPAQHWEYGEPIPYTFDLSLSPRDQQMIRLALRSIEIATCIRFEFHPTKPGGNHIVYVKIATPTFCGLSYIGKISPANPIYLSFACGDPIGVAIHETMHALGVNHEHLRLDRDKYLKMRWENINPQYFDYFAISDPLSYTSYGVPFDFESIMMYGPFTGAVDPNRPSLQPVDDDGTKFAKMGQRKRLSKTDIQLLNKMYCKPPDCVDRNVFCGTWSLRDLCFGAAQSAWMQKHCRRSCNLC